MTTDQKRYAAYLQLKCMQKLTPDNQKRYGAYLRRKEIYDLKLRGMSK